MASQWSAPDRWGQLPHVSLSNGSGTSCSSTANPRRPQLHAPPTAALAADCWYRSDPAKAELIRTTAEHVQRRVAEGARIDVRELPYLLLEHGVQVPALNVNSSEPIADLVGEATRGGALPRIGVVDAVTPTQTGWEVRSGGGHRGGTVVVLALGVGNVSFFLSCSHGWRSVSCLCSTCRWMRTARMLHVVARVGHGYAYVFVKNLPEGQRVVLGHEDLVPDDDPTGRWTTSLSYSRLVSRTPSRSSARHAPTASCGDGLGRQVPPGLRRRTADAAGHQLRERCSGLHRRQRARGRGRGRARVERRLTVSL